MNIVTDVVLPIALAFIMFSLGLGLSLSDFTRIFTKPKEFFIGFLSQLIILPIVALILVSIWPLSPEIAIGVMILAAAPGGATSNILTSFAKGDVVTYLLSERLNPVTKKIQQNGKQMKKVEEQQPAQTSSPQNNVTLTQQQSIALSVASKLGFETVTSATWQETLKIKAKKTDCKEGEEIEQATLRLQAEAQQTILTSIAQISIAYYNLLTTKPQ